MLQMLEGVLYVGERTRAYASRRRNAEESPMSEFHYIDEDHQETTNEQIMMLEIAHQLRRIADILIQRK